MSEVFLLAGEHSGDALGGRLMEALRAQKPGITFEGIGGPLMQAQGLTSLKPMEDLCVMGIVEILKHYPRLRRLGFEIIEYIERAQPDIVVTIDLPDFNFAIAKRLKKRGIYKGKIIHYVAPSVWAWRPGRAKKIAQFLDGLICLFPFEPEYFTAHGLKAAFVGHSMIESEIDQVNGQAFRAQHDIPQDKKVIGLLFGSRSREVEMIGPVFQEVMKHFSDVHFVTLTLPKLEVQVRDYLSGSYTMVTEDKWNAFAACDAAAAVSGTVALELAYMGVPHVIGYKAHPLTAYLARLLIKTKYVHLANILLQQEAVPELLQEDCTAEKFIKALNVVLTNPEPMKTAFSEVKEKLQGEVGDKMPSEKAADFVIGFLP